MARLTTEKRKKLPRSAFGLPGAKSSKGARGKYPTDTPGRARAAKSYASKEEHAGKLSKAQEKKIDAKADRELYGSGGKPHRAKRKK